MDKRTSHFLFIGGSAFCRNDFSCDDPDFAHVYFDGGTPQRTDSTFNTVSLMRLRRGSVTAGQVIDLDFDAHQLASGIYYYNLMHKNGLNQRGKLLLTK